MPNDTKSCMVSTDGRLFDSTTLFCLRRPSAATKVELERAMDTTCVRTDNSSVFERGREITMRHLMDPSTAVAFKQRFFKNSELCTALFAEMDQSEWWAILYIVR